MKSLLAGGVIGMTLVAGAVAQDMPQRGDVAFGRQPMIRGTATATAPDRITIKTDTGETYTVALSANTRIMHQNRIPGLGGGGSQQAGAQQAPQTMKAQEIKTGDGIAAMGELDAANKTVHALFVGVMDAEQVKKLREGLGKEYIAGKITAMDDVKLTILRSDNVSQVIEVDETTSFRKAGRRGGMRSENGGNIAAPQQATTGASAPAGESITLADVKVGDMVAGQGSVKHGIFVPTSLTIMAAGGTTPRMHREGNAAAPAANSTPNQ